MNLDASAITTIAAAIAALGSALVMLMKWLNLRLSKEIERYYKDQEIAMKDIAYLRHVEKALLELFMADHPGLKKEIRTIAMLESGYSLSEKYTLSAISRRLERWNNKKYIEQKLDQKEW